MVLLAMVMPGRSFYRNSIFVACEYWHDSNTSFPHARNHIENRMHLAMGAEESPLILESSADTGFTDVTLHMEHRSCLRYIKYAD
jgi:uncharacterized protein YfeS